jgi:hypothetical protein
MMAIFLPVLMVSVFTFVSISVWSESRRKEREAFYRSEVLKKVAESSGTGGTAALELMREQERVDGLHRREGQKLGGLIVAAIGIALMIFLRAIVRNEPVFLVGLIPMFVGVALLVYGFLVGERA